jgi:hypothetical protein
MEAVSFQVVPARDPAEAEQRLRAAGFDRVERSHDGQWLRVVASREQVARVFGAALQQKRRRRRVGPVEREVVDFEVPRGAVLPAAFEDTVTEVIFPVTADYYHGRDLP